MRNSALWGALSIAFAAFGCWNHLQPLAPEVVVFQWQQAIDHNQFDKARSLSSGQARSYIDFLDALTNGDTTDHYDTQLLEMHCEIRGDSALCRYVILDDVGEKVPGSVTLRRQRGQWLVDRVEDFELMPLDTLYPGEENLVFPPTGDSTEMEME